MTMRAYAKIGLFIAYSGGL